MAEARSNQADTNPGVRTSPGSESQKPLIAIVEDEQDSAQVLSEILAESQYRTIWFSNGADALAALKDRPEPPQMILLDLLMPQMDGWTFRVRQRALDSLKEVPVVVMSADRSPQALAIDADALLIKPVRAERLLRVVDETLLSHERKKLLDRGREVERLRSLGMLVGTVAHELINPLAYVQGSLELIAKSCEKLNSLTADMTRCAEAARSGTEAAVSIVDELRMFSRVEPEEHVASVNKALDAALRLAQQTLQSKARVERDVPADLPPVVGNDARLSQVFLNLLINAAQAIAPDAVARNWVRISAWHEQARVIVEIADSGQGIPQELATKIFDPFFTTKAPGEGTGIGLSFSKDVIERFGGNIRVISAPGQGAVFRVTLVAAPEASA